MHIQPFTKLCLLSGGKYAFIKAGYCLTAFISSSPGSYKTQLSASFTSLSAFRTRAKSCMKKVRHWILVFKIVLHFQSKTESLKKVFRRLKKNKLVYHILQAKAIIEPKKDKKNVLGTVESEHFCSLWAEPI